MIGWNEYLKSCWPVAMRTRYFFVQCAPLSLVYRGVHPAHPLLLEPVHVVRQGVARLRATDYLKYIVIPSTKALPGNWPPDRKDDQHQHHRQHRQNQHLHVIKTNINIT